MANELKNLLVEQSIIIASIKRAIPNFKKIGKTHFTSNKAKTRLDQLEALWNNCRQLDVQLHQMATIDEKKTELYFTEEVFFAAEDVYQESADYFSEIIGTVSQHNASATSAVSEISSREAANSVSLQLSRILLPKFSGNYAEWENFCDIFESRQKNRCRIRRSCTILKPVSQAMSRC